MPAVPTRPRSTLLAMTLLWVAFYASFTLFTPPLLDDADSVHAEVAREMLLRHDYVTLYANGIRYLEKAPLMYWAMALSMKIVMLFGATSPRALAAAARFPIACDVLGLVWIAEMFARRLFRSARAGLYAVLILLSSFGMFLFTRITLPDAGVCLWLTLALYAFWRTEELGSVPKHSPADRSLRIHCGIFAVACALNVLTKGLIGALFPVSIVAIYLLLTRGLRGALHRLSELHPLATFEAFVIVAAPWHIFAGLANPTQGHPAVFHFVNHHWIVPLPTDGNVRGWFWFYFMNEHVLRYLNLRVPHDYDTAPLWLFWGLCLVWMMPWSAFVFKAVGMLRPNLQEVFRLPFFSAEGRALRSGFGLCRLPRLDSITLLTTWAAVILFFFSFSTRQEYYVLPALPALAILISGWLTHDSRASWQAVTEVAKQRRRASIRISIVLLALGTIFAAATIYFLVNTRTPAANTDLASLLAQNPGDYALSMGHFLDLNAQALGLFRLPLTLAALSLFLGPLASFILRRRAKPDAANLALAAGAFGFLLAAHFGFQTFAPVLTSAQLAQAIAPQVHANDLVAIHGEYESGSTLGFYLQRTDIHILDGRSSNLWYGSFFPDAPAIFETPESIAAKWAGPQRIFLWQSLTDPPNQLPALPGTAYVLAKSGGKEIVSNQPNH